MKRLFQILNELKRKKIISEYAIGGGVATLVYVEPILTYDIDIFVVIKTKGPITLLSPIYNYLKSIGYDQWVGEHIIIEGHHVQFIPADQLETEAVLYAKIKIYPGTRVKVVAPEYLIALFLRAGRSKDKIKAKMLLDQAKINMTKLMRILRKYDLVSRYRKL